MDDSSTNSVASVPEPPPCVVDALEQDLSTNPRAVRGRRLQLNWHVDPQVWHREARAAEQLVCDLPIGAEVPRSLCVSNDGQSLLNVPLMWGAASTADNHSRDWIGWWQPRLPLMCRWNSMKEAFHLVRQFAGGGFL